MKVFSLVGGVVIALGLATAGCGDDNPVAQDSGVPHIDSRLIDAPVDAPIVAATLTSFVIDLINNHTNDPTPAAFTAFDTLPDPDKDNNNIHAYDSLFP